MFLAFYFYESRMRNSKQINAACEFGRQPRQRHRVYSIFGGAICLQIGNGNSLMKILELYARE